MTQPDGAALYDDVAAYARQPHHRTGTSQDAATIGWFAELMRSDGASVEIDPWTFPRWDATWSAEIDGRPIECCPRFYSAIGTFGPDEIGIVATEHPAGLLVAKNVHVRTSQTDALVLPTMQVPGSLAGREADVRTRIIDAHVAEGRSANVLASWGGSFADAEIVIGTPISGWFACASERGTGIAVARWLAGTLAEQGRRVALLATSGHELFNIGLAHHLATNAPPRGVIVHIGASVAALRAGGATDELSDTLLMTTNCSFATSALVEIGFRPRTAGSDPSEWIGEATQWSTTGRPLLSIAGVSHWFHTPQDLPDVATSPGLLRSVATALASDVEAFLGD